jgi:hypothetical protein
MGSELFGSANVSFSYLESGFCNRPWKLRLLEKCARSREKNSHFAAPDPFQSFDAFTRNLGMGLGFAETLARRIKRDRSRITDRLEVREPPLGTRYAFGDDDEEPAGSGVRERGDGDSVPGTWKAGYV